jgi:murein DD-endopeptidase MepM/ murein hydrolase activator NlpD
MKTTRRDFLYALSACAPLVLSIGCAGERGGANNTSSASEGGTKATEGAKGSNVLKAPELKVFSAAGRSLITEGKTVLVSLAFSAGLAELSGSLPIQIEPESAGGQQLTEPQPIYFYPSRDGRTFRAILSAPLDAVEGQYTLQLNGRPQSGEGARWDLPFQIVRGRYPETSLTLDKEFSDPSPESAAQMKNDFETMLKIYKGRTEQKWREPFIQPLSGPDKDNFGNRRTVNGTKRYRHAGLDYRAAMGTPVRAVNDGAVVLSGVQWVPGQTICIDHGGGVFSRYLHLSERQVQAGANVRRGDVIGLSGDTGGQKPPPHLHLDLVVNGTRVDPKDFMKTAEQMLTVVA